MRPCLLAILLSVCPLVVRADEPWKAGAAAVVITPDQPLWMAGYASRDKPAEGKATDLFAKALVVEDPSGKRLAIITMDLISIPKAMRDHVVQAVREKHKLPPESIVLNCSHTHCGPVIRLGTYILYDLEESQRAAIEKYIAVLHEKLVSVVDQAVARLEPAKLGYSHARAGFAMNRRLPTDKGYQNSPYPDGPVDQDVPVLRVVNAEGKLKAVLFGYACHNTTLSFFQFCGDYAGFAQQAFEESHPGTVALFFMGCGGDQNPYPRGTIELARQHGRTLATAIDAALLPEPQPVRPPLRTAFAEAALEFAPAPEREELVRLQQSSNKYEKRHAEVLLEQLKQDGKIRQEYPYPVQSIQFGKDLTMVTLGGETVVDYSLRIKQEVTGNPVWVAGYSNDVFGYIPSQRVLKEGGYEATGAMLYTSLPGPFALDVEDRIMSKVHELVRQVRE